MPCVLCARGRSKTVTCDNPGQQLEVRYFLSTDCSGPVDQVTTRALACINSVGASSRLACDVPDLASVTLPPSAVRLDTFHGDTCCPTASSSFHSSSFYKPGGCIPAVTASAVAQCSGQGAVSLSYYAGATCSGQLLTSQSVPTDGRCHKMDNSARRYSASCEQTPALLGDSCLAIATSVSPLYARGCARS